MKQNTPSPHPAEAAPGHGVQAGAHGSQGAEGAHEAHVPELENFWNLLAKSSLNREDTWTHSVIKHFDPYVPDPAQATMHKTNQCVFFSLLTVTIAILCIRFAIRKRALIPDRAQSLIEMLIEGLRNFFLNILGKEHGPRYIPFLLGLFFFILFNNYMGLIPFGKASTSVFQLNIMLGLAVFVYVQYTGLRYLGPKKYLLHLLGNPQGVIMWLMAPFLFVLELISEIVRPISLSLRLFGNILGEDVLLGVFAMLGITVATLFLKPIGVEHPIVGIPLQLPFLFLTTLTSTIQALIFSLLTCVYILLVLPHKEGGEH